MTGYHRGMVVLLAPDSDGLPAALARAVQRAELPLPAVIGVGDPRPRLGEAGASCREAVAAAEVSLTLGRRRATAFIEDVLPRYCCGTTPSPPAGSSRHGSAPCSTGRHCWRPWSPTLKQVCRYAPQPECCGSTKTRRPTACSAS
jgi:hypothetical protein